MINESKQRSAIAQPSASLSNIESAIKDRAIIGQLIESMITITTISAR